MAKKVLTYHKINPDECREQAGYLAAHPETVITFDDGLVGFPIEIIKEFNLKTVLFINPGLLGQGDRMTRDEIVKLSESGVTIANHTFSHKPLADLNSEEVKSEYERARDWIKENIKINAEPEIIALPKGSESKHTRTQLSALGAKLIYGSERIDVYPGRSLRYFKYSLNPVFQFLRRNKKILASLATLMIILFAIWFPQRGELPLFWYDEAVNVRLSRNLAEQGYLNLQTAPGVEYEKPYQFQTSGYPLNAPLALLFKIFGFSFELARSYMFGWFILFLLSAYLLGRKLFGDWAGLGATFLLATFPPIIYHGFSIIGEIPGITLILLSAYFLERKVALSGLFLGLAIATKPIFAPIIIAAIFVGWKLKWTKRDWLAWTIALIIPLMIFMFIVLPTSDSLLSLLATYMSRANAGNILGNIVSNVNRFIDELSLIHVTGLFGLILILRKKINWTSTNLFLISSAVLMFLFFLQSSGWHRYLLTTQVLLLLFLPQLLGRLLETRFPWKPGLLLLMLLIITQGTYALTKSELVYLRRPWAQEVTDMINRHAPTGSIYVITSAEPASLIASDRLYFYTRFEGRAEMPNKLADLITNDFDYIISKPTNPDLLAYQSEVSKYYDLTENLSGLALFSRKR